MTGIHQMSSTILQTSDLKLSICITTFNRAAFIGATLESILVQLTNDCEVVVLDGASTDGTQQVVSEYAHRFERLRYFKQETNSGFDRDCDRVVELARGEYCWLMTDDDLLNPGAVAAVLEALRGNFSLVVVNVEGKDFSMSRVTERRWLDFESNRVYGPEEMDRLFVEMGDVLTYVGCIVVKRAIWLDRERARYYGSYFVYVGVIFQERLPGETLVIAEPYISYRRGNTHSWSAQRTEIIFVTWPSLVASLALSESVKTKDEGAVPWKNLQRLLLLRGAGLYSLSEYRRWVRPRLRSIRETLNPMLVALIPGVLLNTFFVLYYSIRQERSGRRTVMRESRFHFENWRVSRREYPMD
jgi:abequosyltransferase